MTDDRDRVRQAVTTLARSLARSQAECDRLRAEVEQQKQLNLSLAERLAAASEVLGRAAERGKVCGCETQTRGGG